MVQFYTEKFLSHFREPSNVGEIKKADGIGQASACDCGDVVRVTISIDGGRVSDSRFKASGCATAIAGGSLATEMVKGMTLEDAADLSADVLAEGFGGMPEQKIRCLDTVCNAVRLAIERSQSTTQSRD